MVPAGHDTRLSGANVRYPAAAQVEAGMPFDLDGLPGPRPAGHGRWRGGDAPSARAASLASSAALLYAPGDAAYPARWRAGDPYVIPYVNPYVIPYAQEVRTPGFAGRAHQCRKVRFAQLIQRPVRVLGGPAVRAACGGNLSPALVATWRGAGTYRVLERNWLAQRWSQSTRGVCWTAKCDLEYVRIITTQPTWDRLRRLPAPL